MTLSLKQKLLAAALSLSAFFAAALIILCLPSTSYAAQLGAEQPHIYFTYEKDGQEVDGNDLLSDSEYDVKIWIKGVESISTLQVTATLADSVTCASAPTALMSDSVSGVTSMGYVLNSGNVVFGFVSDNADTTAIDSSGTLIACVSMTFAQAGDAESFITVSTNPNLTFVQTDYNEGYENAYAINTEFEGYSGTLYPMTYDISPVFTPAGFDISGTVMIATDSTGTASSVGITGITVTVSNNGTTVASAVTDENGNYTLSCVPAGDYTMTISGPTTVDREVTLSVTGEKTVDPVGVIICDYSTDKLVDSTDLTYFLGYYGGDYYIYADLNGDALVDSTDLTFFLAIYGKATSYPDVTL